MKTLTRLLFSSLVFVFLFFVSCKLEELTGNPTNQIDSINLKLVDINPDSSWIKITSGCEIEIMYEITGTFYNGPHEYQSTRYTIKSLNTDKLQISYGRIDETNQIIFLKQDSIINEFLNWTNQYVCGGISEGGSIGYRTKYVGIKIVDENITMYGWLHKPTTGIIDKFAIDTTGTATVVFAGKYIGIK